ncbi:helix-turn-helix transcriptional regulator [Streptococcus pneumoniae]
MAQLNLKDYISKRVRVLRLQKGLTQMQLEERANLPLKYIYKIENTNSNITIKTLESVIQALDCDFETFFDMKLNLTSQALISFIDKIDELEPHKQEKVLHHFTALLDELHN